MLKVSFDYVIAHSRECRTNTICYENTHHRKSFPIHNFIIVVLLLQIQGSKRILDKAKCNMVFLLKTLGDGIPLQFDRH